MPQTFTDKDKLSEVRREIAMRRRVYGRDGAMTPKQTAQIAIMEAIAADYEAKIAGDPGPLFGGNGNG